MKEIFVDGERTLLVETEEEVERAFNFAFDNGMPLTANHELARQMGCPDQEELGSAEAEIAEIE